MKKRWINVLMSAAIATGALAVIPTAYLEALPPSEQSATVSVTDEEAMIRQLTQQWFQLWSPGKEPMNWEAMSQLFTQDSGNLLVFDDAGGEVVVLESWEDYRNTWEPFMEKLTGWQVEPEGEVRVMVDGGLATTMFTLAGGSFDQQGNAVKFRQRGTHVWQQVDNRWVIVHEHLTTDS